MILTRFISSRIAGPSELFSPDFRACARSPRWATRCSFAVQLSQLQLRCSTSISGPQASSLRSERSAERAGESVIAFCLADRNLSSKSLANYFQSKKRKSKVVRRSQIKKKKTARDRSINLRRRSRPPPSIDRRPPQPWLLLVSFQICRVWFL